jgi:hypothetical protein
MHRSSTIAEITARPQSIADVARRPLVPALMLHPPRHAGLTPLLLTEGRWMLGSDASADWVLTAEGIAPQHLLIVVGPSRTVIKAWDPRCWLNEGPFREAVLRAGDRLTLGPWTFQVRASALTRTAPHGRHDEASQAGMTWPAAASAASPAVVESTAAPAANDPSGMMQTTADSRSGLSTTSLQQLVRTPLPIMVRVEDGAADSAVAIDPPLVNEPADVIDRADAENPIDAVDAVEAVENRDVSSTSPAMATTAVQPARLEAWASDLDQRQRQQRELSERLARERAELQLDQERRQAELNRLERLSTDVQAEQSRLQLEQQRLEVAQQDWDARQAAWEAERSRLDEDRHRWQQQQSAWEQSRQTWLAEQREAETRQHRAFQQCQAELEQQQRLLASERQRLQHDRDALQADHLVFQHKEQACSAQQERLKQERAGLLEQQQRVAALQQMWHAHRDQLAEDRQRWEQEWSQRLAAVDQLVDQWRQRLTAIDEQETRLRSWSQDLESVRETLLQMQATVTRTAMDSAASPVPPPLPDWYRESSDVSGDATVASAVSGTIELHKPEPDDGTGEVNGADRAAVQSDPLLAPSRDDAAAWDAVPSSTEEAASRLSSSMTAGAATEPAAMRDGADTAATRPVWEDSGQSPLTPSDGTTAAVETAFEPIAQVTTGSDSEPGTEWELTAATATTAAREEALDEPDGPRDADDLMVAESPVAAELAGTARPSAAVESSWARPLEQAESTADAEPVLSADRLECSTDWTAEPNTDSFVAADNSTQDRGGFTSSAYGAVDPWASAPTSVWDTDHAPIHDDQVATHADQVADAVADESDRSQPGSAVGQEVFADEPVAPSAAEHTVPSTVEATIEAASDPMAEWTSGLELKAIAAPALVAEPSIDSVHGALVGADVAADQAAESTASIEDDLPAETMLSSQLSADAEDSGETPASEQASETPEAPEAPELTSTVDASTSEPSAVDRCGVEPPASDAPAVTTAATPDGSTAAAETDADTLPNLGILGAILDDRDVAELHGRRRGQPAPTTAPTSTEQADSKSTSADPLAALRSQLAQMFDLPADRLANRDAESNGDASTDDPSVTSAETGLDAAAADVSIDTRSSRSQAQPTQTEVDSGRVAEVPVPAKPSVTSEPVAATPAVSEEDDSIASYMERLLARTRRSGSEAPPAPAPTKRVKAPVVVPTPVEAPSALPVIEPLKAVDRSYLDDAPKHQIDKFEARQHLEAFREVANISARKAVSKYTWQTMRTQLAVKGALTALTSVGAIVFLGGSAWHQVNQWAQGIGCLAISIWLMRDLWIALKKLREYERQFSPPITTRPAAISEPPGATKTAEIDSPRP